jgi:glycosyltransferase involved in cell wall biosynthesis
VNIVMLTNTYLPHVGGVARSVASFTEALRQRGHHVLVVALTYENAHTGVCESEGVFRVPAIQRFNASDFSVRLPIPGILSWRLERFEPEVIHSHHPFLLGDAALRIAAGRGLPIVFTHHTMYEYYTHYVPGNSPPMSRFVKRLVSDYCNLCDHVIAPSESVAEILRQRQVQAPSSAIPTGIDPHRFSEGDGTAMRRRLGIADDAMVVGHVGRLAPEKNLAFLSRALARYTAEDDRAHVLMVGGGPSEETIRRVLAEAGVEDRLHMTGTLQGQALADAYHAMDMFAFASRTETQGMVLAEAMTAGLPVIALDAPGAREVVADRRNGLLLPEQEEVAFAEALKETARLTPPQRQARCQAARRTAEEFSMNHSVQRLVKLYEDLLQREPKVAGAQDNAWSQTLRLLELEWHLWSARTEAAVESLREQWRGNTE